MHTSCRAGLKSSNEPAVALRKRQVSVSANYTPRALTLYYLIFSQFLKLGCYLLGEGGD